MAGQVKSKRGRRKTRRRGKAAVPAIPATAPEAADYVFQLVRSLMVITRAYGDFHLATYFLEMTALDMAPRRETEGRKPGVRRARKHSRRVTPQSAQQAGPAAG